jgi:hypothetical protein
MNRGGIVFRTVIVPLNGSKSAEAAIPYAVDQATRYGATLVLMRPVARPECWPAFPQHGGPARQPPVWPAGELAAEERRARAYLAGIAGRYRLGIHTDEVVPIGDSYLRLVAEIGRRPTPLVVVAAGGADRWATAQGELTHRLLRSGVAPILAVQAGAPVPASLASGFFDLEDAKEDVVVSLGAGDAAGSHVAVP